MSGNSHFPNWGRAREDDHPLLGRGAEASWKSRWEKESGMVQISLIVDSVNFSGLFWSR